MSIRPAGSVMGGGSPSPPPDAGTIKESQSSERPSKGRQRGRETGERGAKESTQVKPEVEESAGSPQDFKQPPLSKKDCLFIVVVWTSEVVNIALTVFLRKSTKRLFDEESAENIIHQGVGAMLAWGLLITAVVFIVNILGLLKRLRYWLFLASLAVYFVCTSVLGFALNSENPATAIAMFSWTGIWYGVHPLRFVFVFHQYFPMRITHSHQLTAGCLIIIWLVEYILYLWVSPDTYDGTSQNQWGVALLLACVWMGGLFAANMWRNKTPVKTSPVRQVYSQTKYLLQFDRRQKKACIISLWLVVSQWVTFTIVNTVVLFSIDQMRKGQDIPLAFHRFDLIIMIIVAVIVEVLFFALRRYQSELIDLLLISLAFIATIVLLVYLLEALQTPEEPEEEDLSVNVTTVYEKDDWKNEPDTAKIVLYHTALDEAKDGKYMYSINGRSYGNSVLRKNKLLALVPINSSKLVDVRIFSFETGELHKETQLKFEPNIKAMYVDRQNKWEIDHDIEHVNETEIYPQMILINFMKKCSHSEYIKGLFEENLDPRYHPRAIPGGIKNSIPVKMENDVCRFCGPIYFSNKLRFFLKNDTEDEMTWKFNYFITDKVIVLPPYDYHSVQDIDLPFGDANYYQNAADKGYIKKDAYVGIKHWHVIDHILKPQMGHVSFYVVDPTVIRPPRVYSERKSTIAMCFERNIRNAVTYNESVIEEEPVVPVLPPSYHLSELTALGVITGLVLVCYIHLMWTVSPIKWRVPIIYTCFGLAFVGEWMTIALLTEVTEGDVYLLIALTILSLIIHSLGSALFWLKVHKKKTSEEKKDPRKRH